MATSTIKGKQDTKWQTLFDRGSDGSMHYRIIDGICYVAGYNIKGTHNVSLATMPENARPTMRWTVPAAFPLDVNIYVNIETNGTVKPIKNGGGEISQLYFTTAYPL